MNKYLDKNPKDEKKPKRIQSTFLLKFTPFQKNILMTPKKEAGLHLH